MGRMTVQYTCLPSGCGNAAYDHRVTYTYNLAGMLTSEGDGAGDTYTYARSNAGEITGMTDSFSDGTDPANIIVPGSVQNGPFGPTSYSLGNGLSAVNTYDTLGRLSGGWACAGSSQPGCTGGTLQAYGYTAQRSGTHVTQTCDTVLNVCNSFGYDEFNRLTARTVTQGTVQNFTYTYDRYGNRWAQNAPQGGPALSISFNTYNNIINTSGFSNDIPGNIANDSFHVYSYDADGNLISVDNGQTATYYYDSLNQRVRIAPTRGTYEFVWDILGRRVSTWAASNRSFVESNAYTDSLPIAIRAGGQTQFEHQNWLGTERVRTNYGGTVAISIADLPWADGHTPSGDNGDQHDFALMERDLEDNTEHAQFRQYSTNLGRWMSPDSYDRSYDLTNPQSFNRYSYAMNDPANFNDPSGQCPECIVCIVQPVVCGAIVGTITGGIVKGLEDLFGGGSSFHGSLKPRPNGGWDGNFGESLGIPTSIPRGNLGLGIALGLPSDGCEFGACGFQQGDPLGSISVGNGISAVWGGIQGLLWFNHIPYHDQWDSNHRLFGTHYCGPGGGGSETSQLDTLCHIHDDCYGGFGVSASVNLPGNHSTPLSAGQIAGITGCNQALANGARSLGSAYGAAAVNSWLTNGYGFLYPGTNAH
jgi:RHS repeat-associated protein